MSSCWPPPWSARDIASVVRINLSESPHPLVTGTTTLCEHTAMWTTLARKDAPIAESTSRTNDGCSRMTCRCSIQFCWLCRNVRGGDIMSHYFKSPDASSTQCILFENDPEARGISSRLPRMATRELICHASVTNAYACPLRQFAPDPFRTREPRIQN